MHKASHGACRPPDATHLRFLLPPCHILNDEARTPFACHCHWKTSLLFCCRDEMDAGVLETAFLAAQEEVGRQGDVVRSLKAQLKDGKVERVSPFCR